MIKIRLFRTPQSWIQYCQNLSRVLFTRPHRGLPTGNNLAVSIQQFQSDDATGFIFPTIVASTLTSALLAPTILVITLVSKQKEGHLPSQSTSLPEIFLRQDTNAKNEPWNLT